MFGLIHAINSKKEYDLLWNFITNHHEIYRCKLEKIESWL